MSSLRNPGTVAGNIDIPRLYRTKFQAWPSRLMTNAPSHAGGGNRNASTPWYAIGGRIRPIDGFGGRRGSMSINRQTRSSKPMAIPIPLTLFVRRLFYRSIEFPFLSLSRSLSVFFPFFVFHFFRHENTAITVGMKYVFSKYRSLCRFHFYWWLFPGNKTLRWLKASSKIGKICSPIFTVSPVLFIARYPAIPSFFHRSFRNSIPRARF